MVVYALLLQPAISTFCMISNDHIEIVDFDTDKECDEENTLEDKNNEKIEQQFDYVSQDYFYNDPSVTDAQKQSYTVLYDIEIPIPPPEFV